MIDSNTKIEEAEGIQKGYSSLVQNIIRDIGMFPNKHNPNIGVSAISKTFIYSGIKLAEQIILSLRNGNLEIAIVGLRTLFEISINSVYIFNHPKLKVGKKKYHARNFCKEIIRLANKKKGVRHTCLKDTTFKQRLNDIGMGSLYNRDYKILSEWAHLMIRSSHYSNINDDKRKQLSKEVAGGCLVYLHNIFDSICAYHEIALNPDLGKLVAHY